MSRAGNEGPLHGTCQNDATACFSIASLRYGATAINVLGRMIVDGSSGGRPRGRQTKVNRETC